jgi:hypothetical protein
VEALELLNVHWQVDSKEVKTDGIHEASLSNIANNRSPFAHWLRIKQ